MKDEADKSRPTQATTPDPKGRVNPDTEQLAANMSALLLDLVRTPDAEVADWTPSLQAGDRLGRFTLRRELGRGGMGVVWEAEDPDLARIVAVKVVRPGTRAAARSQDWLKREAEAVARLNHPNIVTLFDFGIASSGPFLVFELLRGQPLDVRLRAGDLPAASALSIGIEIARALAHAHGAGVVHRDLKPGNVFVADDGEVKVLDFGLASLLGRSGVGDGGTPAFMAPEQWRGALGDERTDLFALGVTLWNALTGELPYRVADGHSAVEQPGPTPRLPPGLAPARLRRLIERCLERDPEDRPESAKAVLEELRALKRHLDGRPRRRIYAALAATAALATLAAGWLWWSQEPPPGEVLKTVIADVDNQTGHPALDGVSGLLATSLEQSKRLAIIPRARLLAMAREAKLGERTRVDLATARQLARIASAQVLLLPAARRDGAGLAIELRAQEPTTDRALFTLSESARGAAEVTGLLDRLSVAARRKLKERSDDLKGGRIELASAISPNLEAARAYYQGIDCVNQPAQQKTHVAFACPHFFEEALAVDPSFALAHFRLAFLTSYLGGASPEAARSHLAAALRSVGRLPAREALLVRGWSDHLGGRDEAATSALDEALARFPDDADALTLAYTLRLDRHDFAGAIPYLERLVGFDPADGAIQVELVFALGMADRRDELRRVVQRLQSLPPSPDLDRAIVRGLVWIGEGEGALAHARRGVERWGPEKGGAHLNDALVAVGAFAQAEPLSRAEVATRPDDAFAYWRLAYSLGGQGRLREALAVLDLAEQRTRPSHPAGPAYVRAMFLAGGGDPKALWRAVARAQAQDPAYVADLAVPLALVGDLTHAGQVAEKLKPGSPALEQYEALLLWRQGDAVGAAARLEALETRERWPFKGLAPAYLLAEVSAASGESQATLAAVERYRRLWPTGYWRAWAWPRTFLLTARALVALGRREEARVELDRLLDLLKVADSDLPLLREARAFRARL